MLIRNLLLALTLAAALSAQTPLTSIDLPDADAIIRLEFGLTATEEQAWEGSVATSSGKVLSCWGWHFTLPDRIEGTSAWSFATRRIRGASPKYRGKLPPQYILLPNGVLAAVQAPETARFTVKTGKGNFSFTLGELKRAGRLPFLDGNAAAVYTPPVRPLTRGEASQHDFPSAAARGDDLYVAWVTFHNEANMVYMARRRDGQWETHRVAPSWGDYYGSAVAMDSDGGAHVVWSEYAGDRWRLVARRFDPDTGRWSPVRYVAAEGRRQMFHRMTTDAGGRPWVVWQEFRDSNFDVFASRHDGDGWSTPLKISESPANDWHPAIAAAPDGDVWIGWDGYDAGNYDVFLRAVRDGKLQPLVRVTRAETWDAHVTLAVDPANRVWLAWEESGANWGKDAGVLALNGIELHLSRRIRLVRYAGGKFLEPARPLEDALPAWMRSKQEYPLLAINGDGMPYLFFREFLRMPFWQMHELQLRFGEKERRMQSWYDTVLHMFDIHVIGFDGSRWGPVRELPQSWGRCWMQTAAALAGDKLLYVWPVDGRSYQDPHVRTAQLRYASFDLPGAPSAAGRMKPFVSELLGAPEAAPTEKEDLARVRAVRWQAKQPLRLFRGELHRHTDISADGWEDGDVIDAYRYAIDAASLDFICITDHSGHERLNYYRYDWWRNRQLATMFDNPGHFTAFFGYERTVTYPGGHRNVISTRRDMVPFRISDEEFHGTESYGERLYPNLIENGDIAIAHTTAGGGGTDWRDWDLEAEPVVEIFQAHRGSYESVDSPAVAGAVHNRDGLVSSAWARGRRLGVIASSDHRSTHQSYACVYAPELTRDAIHAAIKQRRTFAATDNIIVKFEAAAGGRLYKMGEELSAADPPELRVEIHGTGVLSKVELIRNGEVVLARAPGAPTAKFSYRDSSPPPGTACYHLRVVQANKMIAWSSPIWVDPAR